MNKEIIIHGVDDAEGRALLCVSALHHCGKRLHERGYVARFIATSSMDVVTALQDLRFRTGLGFTINTQSPSELANTYFEQADLYIGLATSDLAGISLPESQASLIRCIVATLFPRADELTPDSIATLPLAFDPKLLAERIIASLGDHQCQ